MRSRYFVLFMGISFLGWAVETLFFLWYYGKYWDRGFMTLPFCTIYGFSFLLIYFLIGSPEAEEGGILPRRRSGQRNRLFYLLLSALIPTALELVTGIFFDSVMGLRLWSYTEQRFHFQGYICLEYTLLWAVLVPVCMRYLFVPLKRVIFKMDESFVRRLATVLAVFAAVDWVYHFAQRA